MMIKDGYILRKFDYKFVAVYVGDDNSKHSQLITLNTTGAYIWKLLSSGNKSREEIVRKITDDFDVTPDVAQVDVDEFINIVRNAGLLNE